MNLKKWVKSVLKQKFLVVFYDEIYVDPWYSVTQKDTPIFEVNLYWNDKSPEKWKKTRLANQGAVSE